MTADNWGPAWKKVRAQLWPDDHILANTTVYQLRHTAATTMLRAAVPPAEVARRLGHSVDMLMRVYAGVFEDDMNLANDRLDRFIRCAKFRPPGPRAPQISSTGSARETSPGDNQVNEPKSSRVFRHRQDPSRGHAT